MILELGKWHYDESYRWYVFSKGTGKFAVKKSGGKWYAIRVPWSGDPEYIAPYDSKKDAMAAVENRYA